MSEQANPNPLFYSELVGLSSDLHANTKVGKVADYLFTAEANAVMVNSLEFPFVAKEYPIVFIQQHDEVAPVAVLGLRKNQNLYVDATGTWRASYVPAYVRRYPFALAKINDGENFAVCVDKNYSGFDADKGERLFTRSGEHSDYLKQQLQFLQQFENERQKTLDLSMMLHSLGLLEPMDAKVSMKTGDQLAIKGFYVVNKAKLKSLDDETLKELLDKDQLDLVYAHILSLTNFSTLVDLLAEVEPQTLN